MVEGGKQLSERDYQRLAELHVSSIEDSIPTLVGARFGVEFYRFVAESPREWLLIDRIGEEIVSACVVSDEPDTVYARTVRKTLWTLALHSAVAFFTNPEFRAFLGAYLREQIRGQGEPMPGPEIAYLFTDARYRSRGLGRRMIERVDLWLEERGVDLYWVQTVDSLENRAVSFYERSGFTRAGTRSERGKHFVLFQKTLEQA